MNETDLTDLCFLLLEFQFTVNTGILYSLYQYFSLDLRNGGKASASASASWQPGFGPCLIFLPPFPRLPKTLIHKYTYDTCRLYMYYKKPSSELSGQLRQKPWHRYHDQWFSVIKMEKTCLCTLRNWEKTVDFQVCEDNFVFYVSYSC